MAIVAINGWNRLATSFRSVPGTYQPATRTFLLSYDHRMIDGREAVRFLERLKELVEHLEDLLLEA